MGHHHHHHHHATKNIGFAFFLNLCFTIIEFIGGLITNSVAIISDAIHDLGDSVALGTAWYLEKKSNQEANHKFTYGYRRLSIISAFINCIILLIGSLIVIVEAIKRIMHPEPVDAEGMIYFAILGIVVNSLGAWKVLGGNSLNEKTISWHLLEDVLGWVTVLIGSIIMYFYPIYWIDTVLSIGIAIFISYKVVGRFKQSFYILAQSAPVDIELKEIEEQLLGLHAIKSLHHTHLWLLDEDRRIFTSHVVTDDANADLLPDIRRVLSKWHIHNETIQIETQENACVH